MRYSTDAPPSISHAGAPRAFGHLCRIGRRLFRRGRRYRLTSMIEAMPAAAADASWRIYHRRASRARTPGSGSRIDHAAAPHETRRRQIPALILANAIALSSWRHLYFPLSSLSRRYGRARYAASSDYATSSFLRDCRFISRDLMSVEVEYGLRLLAISPIRALPYLPRSSPQKSANLQGRCYRGSFAYIFLSRRYTRWALRGR